MCARDRPARAARPRGADSMSRRLIPAPPLALRLDRRRGSVYDAPAPAGGIFDADRAGERREVREADPGGASVASEARVPGRPHPSDRAQPLPRRPRPLRQSQDCPSRRRDLAPPAHRRHVSRPDRRHPGGAPRHHRLPVQALHPEAHTLGPRPLRRRGHAGLPRRRRTLRHGSRRQGDRGCAGHQLDQRPARRLRARPARRAAAQPLLQQRNSPLRLRQDHRGGAGRGEWPSSKWSGPTTATPTRTG